MLFEIKSYLQYAIKAKGKRGHGVHSPLIFDLITQVLKKDKQLYSFQNIEYQRELLLRDNTAIRVKDFGAGSRKTVKQNRKISEIAKNALQSKRCAQALAKIIFSYRPIQILELGTSLGITTAYLATAHPKAHVHTIEGSENIAQQAKKTWEELDIKNISQIIGNIDSVLTHTLNTMKIVDFALLDGNHRYEPTIRYFQQILPHCHQDTILILDDIHWSEEMNQAWAEIIKNDTITASIDFFHFGMLFLKPGRQKEHFILWLP